MEITIYILCRLVCCAWAAFQVEVGVDWWKLWDHHQVISNHRRALVINVPTAMFAPYLVCIKANELPKLKYCIHDYLFIYYCYYFFDITCVVNVLVQVLYDDFFFLFISYFSLIYLENKLDDHVIAITVKGHWPFKKCFDCARACLIWQQLWPTVTSAAATALYRYSSLPRRSALSGAIKPCWRKKKLFCQTDWGYECRNSGGVHLFLKIWFWISDFAVWEEKAGTFAAFGITVGEFGAFFDFFSWTLWINCEVLCWNNKEMWATVSTVKTM